MKNRSIFGSLALLAATLVPLVAHADAKSDALEHAGWKGTVSWENINRPIGDYLSTQLQFAKECQDAVAMAKKAGAKPTDEANVQGTTDFPGVRIEKESIPCCFAKLSAIETVCNRHFELIVTYDARSGFRMARNNLATFSAVAEPYPDMGTVVSVAGMKCMEGIDASLKMGATLHSRIDLDGTAMTLAEGKAQICQPLTDLSVKLLADAAKAKAAERDAYLAPYRKVISGDKMKYVEDAYGLYIVGLGRRRLETPADVKNASVFFQHLSRDGDDGYVYHEVRRYQYKGNKLVKQSSKEYRGEPPAKAWR